MSMSHGPIETNHAYLNFSVLKNVSQILCDAVLWPKILLCKVDGLLVRQDGCWVRAEEFLLHTHVVVSDSEYCSAIL